VVYITSGAVFLNRLHRRGSWPGRKTGFSITPVPAIRALLSARVCRSSSRRRNSRYVICSITSSGLLMPPDQNAFQTPSILLFSSPVITALTIVTAADCFRWRSRWRRSGSRRRIRGRALPPNKSESFDHERTERPE